MAFRPQLPLLVEARSHKFYEAIRHLMERIPNRKRELHATRMNYEQHWRYSGLRGSFVSVVPRMCRGIGSEILASPV